MSFLDARTLDDGADLEADLCIVGAGAAGITIAREFIGQPLRIVLLESGGRRFAHRPQFLYIGENVGAENFPTTHSRFRMFGGSTTRWGGQCRPLDPIDFEARPWVPHSGWPFDRAHLEPWYRRASGVCNLGPGVWELDALDPDEPSPLLENGTELTTRIYRFSYPSDFGRTYAAELDAATNITVLLQANAVEIEADESARTATAVRVATLDGRSLRVTARSYVLACGGLENPRLLLASNRAVSAGLGNWHDLVGRFFMDHPSFMTGYLVPAHPCYDRSLHVIEGYAQVGWRQTVHAAFTLSDEVMRAEQLCGSAAYFVRRPNYKTLPEHFSPSGRSFAHLVEILSHATVPDRRFSRHVRNIAFGFRDVRTTLMRRAIELVRPQPRLALRTVLETTPRLDSRVTLGTRRDRFGMPRIRVDWRLSADDLRGLNRLRAVLRREFERCGVGRLVDDESTDEAGWPSSMTGGKHHIGTTRMHADPQHGVVDPDCRVHGMSNLYVAGSSVFPTSGYANPTLTIVALALRLADHLKVRLCTGSSG